MIKSLFYSLTFHSIMILLTVLSLPFMLREPVDLPPIVSVELIQISDKTNIPENKDPIIITINKNNETFISKKRISSDLLNEKLKEIKKANPKTQIYIRADKSVTYDVLMKVMKQIIDSGILNVNLITLPKK